MFFVFVEFPRAVPELQADAPAADQPGQEQQDLDVCQCLFQQGGLLQYDTHLSQVPLECATEL